MKKEIIPNSPIGGVPAPLKQIEVATDFFSIEIANLHNRVSALDHAIAGLRSVHLPRIRAQADNVATNRAQLHHLIDSNRPLFDKPRTRIFSDIKVGLQKQKGKTVIADPDRTVALIEKHFPDRLEELAPSKRTLAREALANLTAAELKKIAVEITADTDAIIIKPQDSDVEKAVAALLAEQTSDLKQAA